MAGLTTDVLVIGGGATGAGVAWDCALRGFDVTLVDRGDLAEGTSGRFHGLLHSGGRYVVKDQAAAVECVEENAILRNVAADTIEDTGGLFVCTPEDDPAFGDRFAVGARETGMPTEEIAVSKALAREPRLNPGITRAFFVQDGSIDVWKTVWTLAHGARAHGGRILTYHKVTGILREDGRVLGARVVDRASGDELTIEARMTINASGAWAAQIAHLAGIEGVGVLPGKGIMIAMNHRLVNTVVNRLVMPADGDIIVPIRTVSVIGTTDERQEDPDDLPITQGEVDAMLADGDKLVPGFSQARALRVWAGVRPLFQDSKSQSTDSRDVSRNHALLDHAERDGVEGLLTITGGKLTTFRRMAQDTVDAMCRKLGEDRPCTTATTELPASEDHRYYALGDRLAKREENLRDEQAICECELVTRGTLERVMRERDSTNLDDIRRQLRLGMGPCQGGFCIYCVTGILHGVEQLDGAQATASLDNFLEERWKGVWPILYGDQLRQARLDDWIFQGLLDVEHLPGSESVRPAERVAE